MRRHSLNRRQFSMIYTLIGHGVHYEALNILCRPLCETTDHRKLPSIFFSFNTEKVLTELAIFSVKKECVTSDVILIVCILIDNS